MLNIAARRKYIEQQRQKSLSDGMKNAMVTAMQSQASKDPENTVKMVFQKEEDKTLLTMLDKLASGLAMLYRKPLSLPKIFQVKGQVEVIKQPSVKIQNLSDLEKYFKSLEQKLVAWAQAASTAQPPVVNVPKIELPKELFQKQASVSPKLEGLIEALNEKLDNLSPKEVKFPSKISVDNFPPQMVPQPVTNISINPLQGFIKTTDNTVGTTVTKLPSYGQLFNRRAVIVYNNSANTIYVGGSDVTTSTGMPVPASSYSPILDAGYNMIMYGVASTSNNDVRVLEVSKDQTANVQE